MNILYTRHAKRRMKWRKISEDEIRSAIEHPDNVETTIKMRYNYFKLFGERILKVTCNRQQDDFQVITALWKGE